MKIERIRPASADEWDAIWRASETASYFHSREWAELWAAYTGGRVRPDPRLVEFDDGGRALLPLLCKRSLGGVVRTRVSSHAESLGGWIAGGELGADHASLLVGALARDLGSVRWKVNPFDPLAAPYGTGRATGGVVDPDETLALELTPGFETLRRAWTKGHKSAVTKARREGVTVREARTEADWRAYYAIFQDSIRRWGERAFARYDWSLFEALSRARSPDVKLWLACYRDQIVAGHLFLYSRRHVADWHGAALEEHFELRPVNLLMSDVLEDACERGEQRWFDFGSSGPLEGVRAFKKSFGAQPFACPTIRVEAAWLRWGRALQRAVARRR